MFHRTQNENGTFNTRCLDCLMSIATAVESPESLKAVEERHLCTERVLRMAVDKQTRAGEAHRAA